MGQSGPPPRAVARPPLESNAPTPPDPSVLGEVTPPSPPNRTVLVPPPASASRPAFTPAGTVTSGAAVPVGTKSAGATVPATPASPHRANTAVHTPSPQKPALFVRDSPIMRRLQSSWALPVGTPLAAVVP